MLGKSLELAAAVVYGAPVAFATQLSLWHFSSRPDGAERHVFTELRRIMA